MDLTRSVNSGQARSSQTESAEFSELKRLIKESGVLEKQPLYYALNILCVVGLAVAGFAFLAVTNNAWLLLLDALFLASVFTQLGFLGHDAGHRQIARAIWRNDVIGLGVSFLLGMSRSWWVEQHNEHHLNPNDLDLDPHTAIPAIAFSQEQAREKRGIMRFLVRYQAFYFFPMLMLEGVGTRAASVQFILRGRGVKYPWLEPLLMAAHAVIYFAMLSMFLEVWQAALFFVVHQGVFGLYMGSVFAPNHKGMVLIDKDTPLDFLRRQVLTSRNIRTHPFTDTFYGGLNFQIEHHLFPSIPRNKLKEAQKIVKEFCARRGIDYHETTLPGSFKEVLWSLHEASAPLRESAAQ